MKRFGVQRAVLVLAILLGECKGHLAFADGDINKVNHVIVLMQQGHSFDNYFGALAYAPGSAYHNGNGACDPNDRQSDLCAGRVGKSQLLQSKRQP